MTIRQIREKLEDIEELYNILNKEISPRYKLPSFDFDEVIVVLTDEEKQENITLDRINSYHRSVGEDFVDQNESVTDYRTFCGYILHKYPIWNNEIIEILNKQYGGFNDINTLYQEKELTEDDFYSDFAEYCNLTVTTKARVNQILIETEEYDN